MMDAKDIIKLAEETELAAETSLAATVETPLWWSNPYLEHDENGRPMSPTVPALIWWMEHPWMGMSHVRFNVIDDAIEAELLPWNPEPHTWNDADSSFLLNEFQELTGGLVSNRLNVHDALMVLAHKRKYNPLLDMLEALPEWDGIPRAATMLTDFLGAEDTEYTRAVSLHILYGAVMRAYRPGCKFDECAVLSSQRQGIGKSTLLRELAMDDRYFMDSLGDISRKDAAENLQGKWIVEIGELNSLKKKDAETIKSFLSKQEDRYRAPYAKLPKTRERKCVFVGTTNSTQFLGDPTGNRRFLPVRCDVVEPRVSVFSPEAKAYIQQIWAEVLFKYNEDGSLPLVFPMDLTDEANEHREAFTIVDAKEGLIREWLKKECFEGDRVCTLQVMLEVLDISRDDAVKPTGKATTNEVVQILDSLPELERMSGRPKHSDEYGQQRCWVYRPNGGRGMTA